MASDDSNKENLGKVEQKMEESNSSSTPMYLKGNRRRKHQPKLRCRLPTAEERARNKEQMEAYCNNKDGKVRPLLFRMDRQEFLQEMYAMEEEMKLLKEAAELRISSPPPL